MQKIRFGMLLIISIFLLSACGEKAEPMAESSEEAIPLSQETSVQDTVSDIETEPLKTESTESAQPSTEQAEDPSEEAPEETAVVGFDRTYLEEKDGHYTYNMQDSAIIMEYDRLYAEAFKELADSCKTYGMFGQTYEWDEPADSNNLVYDPGKIKHSTITIGSTFEMEYNYDYSNVGYTYIDLDSDGTFELILGVLPGSDMDRGIDYFERAYTLRNGKVLKIYEGGSRSLNWLGSDGAIYKNGSSGAAYSGIYRMHFSSQNISTSESVDWGEFGFAIDEYVGYWEKPVYIQGEPSFDTVSNVPVTLLTDDEVAKLQEEWNSRQISINWLKASDYFERNDSVIRM